MARNDAALLEQMSFYGAYHSKFWNQIIHIVFVPLIVWSALVWLSAPGALFSLPSWAPAWAEASPALFAALFYSCYYIYLGDYAVALPVSACILAMFSHAAGFARQYGGRAHLFALLVQAVSWWAQIAVGHNRIEGRKPALLDSLFDALVMAPLFVSYEVLFMAGCRRSFKRKLDARVSERILVLNRVAKAKAAIAAAATAATPAGKAGAKSK